MKKILAAIIALFIITVGHAQLTKTVKAAEDPDIGGEIILDSIINISPRLKNNKGASVFGGKFKHTTVMIHKKPGSHTLYATGMNGKLTNLYAIDTKGNKIPATYSVKVACMACITVKNGLKSCYIMDCSDLPTFMKPRVTD